MSEKTKKSHNNRIVRSLVDLSKRIRLPGLGGFSLYHLLSIYGTGIFKGSFSPRASSIAYSFFLALFPFLLFLLNLIPHVPIAGFQERFLIFIQDLLPPQTSEFFYPVIADIFVNRRTTLLSFVFFLSIILSANGINTIFNSFQHSLHVDLNRKFFKQYLIAIGISILLAFVLIISVSSILYGEYLIHNINSYHIISNEATYVSVVQFLIFVVTVYLIVAILYYFGTRKSGSHSFISVGEAVTTIDRKSTRLNSSHVSVSYAVFSLNQKIC